MVGSNCTPPPGTPVDEDVPSRLSPTHLSHIFLSLYFSLRLTHSSSLSFSHSSSDSPLICSLSLSNSHLPCINTDVSLLSPLSHTSPSSLLCPPPFWFSCSRLVYLPILRSASFFIVSPISFPSTFTAKIPPHTHTQPSMLSNSYIWLLELIFPVKLASAMPRHLLLAFTLCCQPRPAPDTV